MSVDTSAAAVERLADDLIEGREAQSDVHQAIATLRALAAERDAERAAAAKMRDALVRWQHYGCPDCSGDCGSANPPVMCCIMQETRAALAQQQEPGR